MNTSPDRSGERKIFGIPVLGVVVLVVILGGLLVDVTVADGDNFYSDIIRLDNVVTKIHQSYVEKVNSKDLVDKAIDGTLKILDPHTTYFEKKQYEELMIHTEGKFGGLGIQISIRDNVLTVMTPISGTPASRAGIQSGDQILKINGKSTKGITVDQAVGKLRGEPNTSVGITIRRKGEKDIDYTIIREIIRIKSVPYYGVIDKDMGYIRLNTFSKETGAEVDKAIRELLKKNIKGLVFDVRSNPGGLLQQAIEVGGLFLPGNQLVVSTRGRMREQNQQYNTFGSPVLPAALPLCVLVNSASASASEIVAGALQDWDRGVVVGDTTFGKGSVQSILPLPNDPEHHLKLTTAFYYTPSGRCINKPENGIRGKQDSESEETVDGEIDSAAADSIKKENAKKHGDTTTYYTTGRRIVHGGGGIVPDTIVTMEYYKPVVEALFRKSAFFAFANWEYPKLKARKQAITESMTITDPIWNDFLSYLDTSKFEFVSYSRIKYDEFKVRSGLVRDTTADSVATLDRKPKWTDEEMKNLRSVSEQIDKLYAAEGRREFVDNNVEIKRLIKEALLIREFGQDHDLVYQYILNDDNQVKNGIAILRNAARYNAILKPVKK